MSLYGVPDGLNQTWGRGIVYKVYDRVGIEHLDLFNVIDVLGLKKTRYAY